MSVQSRKWGSGASTWWRRFSTTAPHKRVLDGTSIVVAWTALVLALVHPPHGLGIDVCWVRATSGLPCWGCGLSRSLSCCVRGMFAEAWSYHPFGPVFASVLAAIAVGSILRGLDARRVMQALGRFPRALNGFYALLTVSFVVFGLIRAAPYAWTHAL